MPMCRAPCPSKDCRAEATQMGLPHAERSPRRCVTPCAPTFTLGLPTLDAGEKRGIDNDVLLLADLSGDTEFVALEQLA
jgi:hypothetical protein